MCVWLAFEGDTSQSIKCQMGKQITNNDNKGL